MNGNAAELFEMIGTGRVNALKRPDCSRTDRMLRRLVTEANKSGKDCIINTGGGYYRPDFGDEAERRKVQKYLAKELHRCREVAYKYKQMKLYVEEGIRRADFEKWYGEKERE